ncbi:hypothetical protein T03_11152 [Trichinella britovi]|uniref:Uncharacterized protein n=1 Tax=Trichinella britovi TaxID=45882 RepID=A0A0V1C4H1_TRIBR|nr:hypothetical protein T03_11152 [Trichinella britovi]
MMVAITKFRLKMKLFLCVLAIALCATSSLNLFKSKKEEITRAPLKYDEGKVEIKIRELCSTVCSQYSEEYVKLTRDPDVMDRAAVQKADAEFATCHLSCSSSIDAQLKSLQ